MFLMIKEPFIQPRFVGSRFEAHTLPVSAAKDLAAYEELVLELAKHLFRTKHQNRGRIPKGFGNGFNLHLEKIDKGSARPALVAVLAAAELFSSLPVEITEARDLINAVIATEADQGSPPPFPKISIVISTGSVDHWKQTIISNGLQIAQAT